MQQFAYTTGKNATDSSLIIDAMDLLHTGDMDGFCIVSSDSDFTRLATRPRESGRVVYGFGEQKTPKPFVAACDKFVFAEILRHEAATSVLPVISHSPAPFKALLSKKIEDATREDGWAHLGAVGALLSKVDPSFDARNFGHRKLIDLVKAQSYVESKVQTPVEGSGAGPVYVRLRKSCGRRCL